MTKLQPQIKLLWKYYLLALNISRLPNNNLAHTSRCGTTYTNSTYDQGPEVNLRRLVLQMPTNVQPTPPITPSAFFQFYDNAGAEICLAASGCTAAELKIIAMVSANTVIWVQTDTSIWSSLGLSYLLLYHLEDFKTNVTKT